jgi:hypothetical protein
MGGMGATGGTGMGATGGTGMGATGGTGMGGMGATGGTDATGGAGIGGMTSCAMASLDDRRCLIDSDCRLSPPKLACCGRFRVYGLANAATCVEDPVACAAEDCAGPQWITDTMEATFERGEIQVRCEFGEPGAGLCVSFVEGDPPPPYCNGALCMPTDVCVYYATPGGPAPRCDPLLDGGTCPPNTKMDVCPGTGGLGCVEERLAPPPQCVPIPSGCGDAPRCECLPADICGGPATECGGVIAGDVTCLDLSP